MPSVYNPLTANVDYVQASLTIKEVLKSILVESNQALTLPVAAILFDDDSILYNDDEAEL